MNHYWTRCDYEDHADCGQCLDPSHCVDETHFTPVVRWFASYGYADAVGLFNQRRAATDVLTKITLEVFPPCKN